MCVLEERCVSRCDVLCACVMCGDVCGGLSLRGVMACEVQARGDNRRAEGLLQFCRSKELLQFCNNKKSEAHAAKALYGGLEAANTVQLGGGLLEVHADGADALRREPRRHAVREGERCSEAKHSEQILCKRIELATAPHLFASQCELERCVELGVLFAEFLALYLHHSTTKHPLSRCQLAIKQEADNKTGPSLQIKKPLRSLTSHQSLRARRTVMCRPRPPQR